MGMDVNFLLGNKGVYCLKIEELKGSAELQWQAQKTALRISPSSNFCHCALAQNYIDADFFAHGTAHCRLAQSLQMKKSISINYGVLHDHLSLALLAYEGIQNPVQRAQKVVIHSSLLIHHQYPAPEESLPLPPFDLEHLT